jgi:hypothetical protein
MENENGPLTGAIFQVPLRYSLVVLVRNHQAQSGNGLCSALASSYGAHSQTWPIVIIILFVLISRSISVGAYQS